MRARYLKPRFLFYALIIVSLSSVYFLNPVAAPYRFEGQQVWKHRQNTVSQGIQSIKDGFPGVEIDITYLDGHLYVAHDPSEYENAVSLVEYVEGLDRAGGSDLAIWLDIKNIGLFNEGEITRQILSLGISERLLVESPFPFAMFRLCSSGLTCSVWAKGSELLPMRIWYRFWINLLSRYGTVASASVDYRVWGTSAEFLPGEFPKQLYTFPPGTDFMQYRDHPDVRILLTD